jgi:hypothetical protein
MACATLASSSAFELSGFAARFCCCQLCLTMAQSDGGSVAALARACIAAVLSKPMLVDASDMLESAFPEACSFR